MSPRDVSSALTVRNIVLLECSNHCAGCSLWLSADLEGELDDERF